MPRKRKVLSEEEETYIKNQKIEKRKEYNRSYYVKKKERDQNKKTNSLELNMSQAENETESHLPASSLTSHDFFNTFSLLDNESISKTGPQQHLDVSNFNLTSNSPFITDPSSSNDVNDVPYDYYNFSGVETVSVNNEQCSNNNSIDLSPNAEIHLEVQNIQSNDSFIHIDHTYTKNINAEKKKSVHSFIHNDHTYTKKSKATTGQCDFNLMVNSTVTEHY